MSFQRFGSIQLHSLVMVRSCMLQLPSPACGRLRCICHALLLCYGYVSMLRANATMAIIRKILGCRKYSCIPPKRWTDNLHLLVHVKHLILDKYSTPPYTIPLHIHSFIQYIRSFRSFHYTYLQQLAGSPEVDTTLVDHHFNEKLSEAPFCTTEHHLQQSYTHILYQHKKT